MRPIDAVGVWGRSLLLGTTAGTLCGAGYALALVGLSGPGEGGPDEVPVVVLLVVIGGVLGAVVGILMGISSGLVLALVAPLVRSKAAARWTTAAVCAVLAVPCALVVGMEDRAATIFGIGDPAVIVGFVALSAIVGTCIGATVLLGTPSQRRGQ